MKTIEYKDVVDKTSWPRGEWDDEPDKIQWQDEATKLPCLIVRNHYGALCGYVGVPKEHPYYEKSYDYLNHITVHGGLTFAEKCSTSKHEEQSICQDVWWFGFDCGHYLDYIPKAVLPNWCTTYRNVAYVKKECTALALQLHAI